MTDTTAGEVQPEAPREVTHTRPSAGIPEVGATAGAIADIAADLARGTGPIAVDAERASGYRYGQRAYLLQFNRTGSQVALVDPTVPGTLDPLIAVCGSVPWLLHAATQDLPCLREAGFAPTDVLDTELAAKLLGRPKVGLAALLETDLDVVLAKEHSAVDWSTRPLPEEWLAYAALDVEFLQPLHDLLHADLEQQQRLHWYDEERALLRDFTGPSPRPEPWRKTSGIHALRDTKQLAIVRALWEARDARARELDVSPGRVLHDTVIIDIARNQPQSKQALAAMRPVHNRNARKDSGYWWEALAGAYALTGEQLPARKAGDGGLPQPRAWASIRPEAAERWEAVRPVVVHTAEDHGIGAEVLVSPETIRRLCWEGFAVGQSQQTVADLLLGLGTRHWQTELLSAPIAQRLQHIA